jgi:hypothetical protein
MGKYTKITPDLWEISYAVTKRRVGHAPEDSGVPVGTEYHWYILAHQTARKLNANDYETKRNPGPGIIQFCGRVCYLYR